MKIDVTIKLPSWGVKKEVLVFSKSIQCNGGLSLYNMLNVEFIIIFHVYNNLS